MTPAERPYRFLVSGCLEYRDRWGRYRMAGGCGPDTWHQFQEYREEAVAMLAESEETAHTLLVQDERLRHLCDWCLRANGIDPLDLSIGQTLLLMFAHKLDGALCPSPLEQLNEPPPERHPATKKDPQGLKITDKASLLAALQGLRDVGLDRPVRELLAIAQDIAWAATPQEDREKAAMMAQAPKVAAEMVDMFNLGAPPAAEEDNG